jgi:hypothetical protein
MTVASRQEGQREPHLITKVIIVLKTNASQPDNINQN